MARKDATATKQTTQLGARSLRQGTYVAWGDTTRGSQSTPRPLGTEPHHRQNRGESLYTPRDLANHLRQLSPIQGGDSASPPGFGELPGHIIAKIGGSHFIPPRIWRTISANCRQIPGGIAHPPPDLANSKATSSPKSGGVTSYPPGSGEPPFVARATNAASTPRGPSSPPPRSPSHTS